MLGKMFRTELDLELKLRRDGGPPFFDLRESIADIIHHHVKEPEVGLQEHIYSRAFPMHVNKVIRKWFTSSFSSILDQANYYRATKNLKS